MKYDVALWRVPSPVVKQGKYSSVIEDRGALKKAIADSSNNFLFSEAGVGVQPLAIIGTREEIAAYLISNKDRKVVNKIASLPDIYMGVSPYAPGDRFSGLFPVNDFGIQLFSQLAKFFPDVANLNVPTFVEAAGLPGDVKELLGVLDKFNIAQGESQGNVVYLKLSYMPEDKMTKVASREVSFATLLNQLAVAHKK